MIDGRRVRDYLKDIEEMEVKEWNSVYSPMRKRVLRFWLFAIRSGKVSLEDPVPYALEKVRQELSVIWRRH